MIGKRVRVKGYVKAMDGNESVVCALPGETGVVIDASLTKWAYSVVFDRTGYTADVNPLDCEPADAYVDVSPAV